MKRKLETHLVSPNRKTATKVKDDVGSRISN